MRDNVFVWARGTLTLMVVVFVTLFYSLPGVHAQQPEPAKTADSGPESVGRSAKLCLRGVAGD
jgi:hypothetical protein